MIDKENKRKCFKCNSSPADDSVKLFRFPKPGSRNLLRCELWAKYIFPEKNYNSVEFQRKLHSEHRMLCDRHFKDADFTDASKKGLLRTAIPCDDTMRRCIIPCCPSTAASTKLFTFPKNKMYLLLWQEIIAIKTGVTNFSENQGVCCLHFEKKYIKWDGQRELCSIPTLFYESEIQLGFPAEPISVFEHDHFYHKSKTVKLLIGNSGQLQPQQKEHNYVKKRKHEDHNYSKEEGSVNLTRMENDSNNASSGHDANSRPQVHASSASQITLDSAGNITSITPPVNNPSRSKAELLPTVASFETITVDESATDSANQQFLDESNVEIETIADDPETIGSGDEDDTQNIQEEPQEKTFSWQMEEDLVLDAELNPEPVLSLFDDDHHEEYKNETSETLKKENVCPVSDMEKPFTAEHEEGYHCNICVKQIKGLRYVCVQCADFDLCGECEGRGGHPYHYVLRIPTQRPHDEVRATLRSIRRVLLDAVVHVAPGPDDITEIKEEEEFMDDPIDVNPSEMEDATDTLPDVADTSRHELEMRLKQVLDGDCSDSDQDYTPSVRDVPESDSDDAAESNRGVDESSGLAVVPTGSSLQVRPRRVATYTHTRAPTGQHHSVVLEVEALDESYVTADTPVLEGTYFELNTEILDFTKEAVVSLERLSDEAIYEATQPQKRRRITDSHIPPHVGRTGHIPPHIVPHAATRSHSWVKW